MKLFNPLETRNYCDNVHSDLIMNHLLKKCRQIFWILTKHYILLHEYSMLDITYLKLFPE